MPPFSTLRTFVNSLKSGETNITRSLERLVRDDKKREKYREWVDRPNSLDGEFPPWLRTELVQAGMKEAEIEHIQDWPDSQKEVVRAQISGAVKDKRPLRFGWELYDGKHPKSDVRRDSDQEVRIVFQSPREGVELSFVNYGKVRVKA